MPLHRMHPRDTIYPLSSDQDETYNFQLRHYGWQLKKSDLPLATWII